MERLMLLLNQKFLKDYELLELEDIKYVKSCEFSKPYNAHYNEYKVVIDNNGKEDVYTVCCKFK